jgi:hypothetical protein
MAKPALGAFGPSSWGRTWDDLWRAPMPWPRLSGAWALAFPGFLPTLLSLPSLQSGSMADKPWAARRLSIAAGAEAGGRGIQLAR